MAEVFFPARVDKMKSSEEYARLKKTVDKLDAKVGTWISGFDKRLDRVEDKEDKIDAWISKFDRRLHRIEMKIGIKGSGRKKTAKRNAPQIKSAIEIGALRRKGSHSWKWKHL